MRRFNIGEIVIVGTSVAKKCYHGRAGKIVQSTNFENICKVEIHEGKYLKQMGWYSYRVIRSGEKPCEIHS